MYELGRSVNAVLLRWEFRGAMSRGYRLGGGRIGLHGAHSRDLGSWVETDGAALACWMSYRESKLYPFVIHTVVDT